MDETLQLLFERSQDLLCSMSADGKMTYANPSWFVHLGRAPNELKWRYFANILHSEEAEAFSYLAAQVLKSGTPQSMSCRLRHASNGYLSYSCYLIKSAQGGQLILHLRAFSETQELIQRLEGVLWQSALPHFDLTFYNPKRAAEILDVEERLLPKSNQEALSRIHKDDQKYLLKAFRDIRHNKRMRLAYRYLKPNGSLAWIVDDIQLIEDANGDPIAIQGLFYDRTTDKLKEQEMARLLKIIENTPDLVSYVDAHGNSMYSNTAMRRYRGLGERTPDSAGFVALAEQHIDPNFSRIKEAHPPWAADIIMNKGIPEAIEKGIWRGRTAFYKVTREGHAALEVPTDQIIISHKNPNGELEFLSTIIRDVSLEVAQEQKLIEQHEALRVQSERTALILSSRKMGIWEWNTLENKLIWDENMFELFNLKRTEFKETYDFWLSRVMPEDRERVHAEIEKSIRLRRDLSIIYRTKNQAGDIKHIAAMGTAQQDSQGLIERFLGISWDVTEEKHQQEALEQQRLSQMQNSRLAAVGEMAAAMAHEINNPLSIISGRAAQIVCALDMPPADPKEVRAFAQRIEDSVKRIAKVIHSLKAFAAGDNALIMARNPVKNLVEDALNLCREKLRSHAVGLTLHIPENLFLECSSQHMSQTVLTFLNQSFENVKNLKDKWIEIEAKEMDLNVMIAVTDSSSQCQGEFLNRLFKPIYGSKESGDQSLQLDLVSTRGIINAHGGRIRYVQESPHARFEIFIPKTKRASAA